MKVDIYINGAMQEIIEIDPEKTPVMVEGKEIVENKNLGYWHEK